MIAGLTILLIALVAAVLHPYTTYPLSLALVRLWNGTVAIQPSAPPPSRFAIVCCAFDEFAVIEKKVANSLAISRMVGNCDVLFYSDASTDGTSEYLTSCPAPVVSVIGNSQVGKTAGMNRLLSMTDAEIVIFTDANVMIEPSSVLNLKRYFQDPNVGMVTGTLHFLNGDASTTAEVSSAYRGFEEMIKRLETDTGSVVYTDGTMFAMRRSLFTLVPANLTDDLFTAIMVLLQGKRNVAARDFVAYEQAATARKDELRRRIRIGCHVFNCHLLLWPRVRQLDGLTLYKYVSHKLVRWFAGYFIAAAALCLILAVALYADALIAAALAAVFLVLGAASLLFRIPIVSSVCEGVLVTFAVAYGVSLAIRGEQFRTWVVASSSRGWQDAPPPSKTLH